MTFGGELCRLVGAVTFFDSLECFHDIEIPSLTDVVVRIEVRSQISVISDEPCRHFAEPFPPSELAGASCEWGELDWGVLRWRQMHTSRRQEALPVFTIHESLNARATETNIQLQEDVKHLNNVLTWLTVIIAGLGQLSLSWRFYDVEQYRLSFANSNCHKSN